MLSPQQVFVYLGAISLLTNAISDLRTKEIESVKNYAMGLTTVALFLVSSVPVWFMIVGAVSSLIGVYLIRGQIAGGDLEAFPWITTGFFLLNYYAFALFYGLLWVFSWWMRFLWKKDAFPPAYPAIFGAFAATGASYLIPFKLF